MAPHHGTVRGPLPLIRPSSPGVGTRWLPTLAVLLHLLLATGCGTTSKVVEKSGVKDYPEASALGQVWVLDPLLTVERMEDGKPSPPPQGAEFIGQDLARLALESLQSHGIKADSIQSSAASGAAARAAAVEITASSDVLVQPTKPEHVTQSLHRFGQNTGSGAVLVQHVRIRLGPGGSWDPNTGQITSPMNSTRLIAALVACETGQVLWRNEVYLREVPRVKDSDYRDAAHRLFPQRAAPPKKR